MAGYRRCEEDGFHSAQVHSGTDRKEKDQGIVRNVASRGWTAKHPDGLEEKDWQFRMGVPVFTHRRTTQRFYAASERAEADRRQTRRAGLTWHSLRHACRAWLSSSGATLTTQKGLLRHADESTTSDIYGYPITDDMRKAHDNLVSQLLEK